MANSLFVTPPYGQVSAAMLNVSMISVSESVGAAQNRDDNAQSWGPSPMRVGSAAWRRRSITESRSTALRIRRRQALSHPDEAMTWSEERGIGMTIPFVRRPRIGATAWGRFGAARRVTERPPRKACSSQSPYDTTSGLTEVGRQQRLATRTARQSPTVADRPNIVLIFFDQHRGYALPPKASDFGFLILIVAEFSS